jgi:hypothetical protein
MACLNRLWTRQALATMAAVLLLMVNLTILLAPALVAGYPVPDRCDSQVPLTAHSEVILGRHRQWLETPPHFAEPSLSLLRLYPHRVVDMRTGLAYD